MKRYIRSSMNPDILSYKEKEELARELLRIVEKYFDNHGHGSPSPHVAYHEYDIKEYTFSVNSSYYNSSVEYLALVDGGYNNVDLNQFKAEVRSLLKGYGFKKVAFDMKSFKEKGDQYTGYYKPTAPVYTYKELYAIYFGQ